MRAATITLSKTPYNEKGQDKMDYAVQSRNNRFEPPNCSAPTHARPGSAQKLQIMAERFRSGQPLHHPNDGDGEEAFPVRKAMAAFLALAYQNEKESELRYGVDLRTADLIRRSAGVSCGDKTIAKKN